MQTISAALVVSSMRVSVCILLFSTVAALARAPLDAWRSHDHWRSVGEDTQPSTGSTIVKRATPRQEQNLLQRFGSSPFVTGCITAACAAYIGWRMHQPADVLPLTHVHMDQTARIRNDIASLRAGKLGAAGKSTLNERLQKQEIEHHALNRQLEKVRAIQKMKGAASELAKLEQDLARALQADHDLRTLLQEVQAESDWNRYLLRKTKGSHERQSGLPSPSEVKDQEKHAKKSKDSKELENPSNPENSKILVKRSPAPTPVLRSTKEGQRLTEGPSSMTELSKSKLQTRSDDMSRLLVSRALAAQVPARWCAAVLCAALLSWSQMPYRPPLELVGALRDHSTKAAQLRSQMERVRSGALNGHPEALQALWQEVAKHERIAATLDRSVPRIARHTRRRNANRASVRELQAAIIHAMSENRKLHHYVEEMIARDPRIPKTGAEGHGIVSGLPVPDKAGSRRKEKRSLSAGAYETGLPQVKHIEK